MKRQHAFVIAGLLTMGGAWLLLIATGNFGLFLPFGCIAPAVLFGMAITASERAQGKETAVTNGVICGVVLSFVLFLLQGVVILVLATA